MSAISELEVVGEVLRANYSALGITKAQVAWPNQDFKPPKDQLWCRVATKAAMAFPLELGRTGSNGTDRAPGTLMIQVFGPTNKGAKATTDLADAIGNLFRRERFTITNGQILFRVPMVDQLGTDKNGYYQVQVSIPFIRDTAI